MRIRHGRDRMCSMLVGTALPFAIIASSTAGCDGSSTLYRGGDGIVKSEQGSPARENGNESSVTSGAAHGLGLRTTTSLELCEVLRRGVNDSTFGRPVTETHGGDYKPGEEDNDIYTKCELATEDIEMDSDPSGGALLQRGVASLQLSAPYLVNDTPSSHPASWFLGSGGKPGCQGSDDPLLGTETATYWCVDDTAHGMTAMYFTDMLVVLDMQAPLKMTTGFTKPAFEKARENILAALSGS